jgi:hypothetical protein
MAKAGGITTQYKKPSAQPAQKRRILTIGYTGRGREI